MLVVGGEGGASTLKFRSSSTAVSVNRNSCNLVPGGTLNATQTSIGLALPAAGHQYGYISEHHGYGMIEQRMRDFVEDMAATMLATTLGIEFDPETAYDQRKEIYHMSGKIIKTRACAQTAEGDKSGLWTTVIAAAVFLFREGE